MKLEMSRWSVLVTLLALLGLAFSASPSAAAGATMTGVVNVNEASAAQLQLLPGIGLSKARAIIEYRRKQTFSSPDDLTRVKGIGKGLLKKIRPYVVTKGKTTAKAPSKKKRTKAKS